MTNTYEFLAVCYPLGLIPKAPGTFGSLPGLLLGYCIYQASLIYSAPAVAASGMLLSFMLFAWWIIAKTEAHWGTHDDKSIVIDEVAGQAIPLAFISSSLALFIMSFIIFRVLDISKPLIIGWADEKLNSSFGTLFDDVLAGIGTLIFVWLAKLAEVI